MSIQKSIHSDTKVKCVVFDLDNTLWNGIILEDENVTLREGIVDVIKELDRRGILLSIASKNNFANAMHTLERLGIKDYFLYPQINWNAKSSSIKKIADLFNINIDTFAFIDDQPFEREEVSYVYPQVLVLDETKVEKLLDMPQMNPHFVTPESKNRRLMYINEERRKQIEEEFEGAQEEFLASLKMKLTIGPVTEDDLKRAEELTVRTNQLNTTGQTYSFDELNMLRKSDDHKLYIVELDDKYGTYGKIGLALIECTEGLWRIKLLLMSCRVISRGVGSILISHIIQEAKKKGIKLQAEFLSNERNRMMFITYKFAGFYEVESINERVIFEHNLENIAPFPNYVDVIIAEEKGVY